MSPDSPCSCNSSASSAVCSGSSVVASLVSKPSIAWSWLWTALVIVIGSGSWQPASSSRLAVAASRVVDRMLATLLCGAAGCRWVEVHSVGGLVQTPDHLGQGVLRTDVAGEHHVRQTSGRTLDRSPSGHQSGQHRTEHLGPVDTQPCSGHVRG